MKNIIDELTWRGLIYDATDIEELRERLNKPITVYAGFDPTADSVHVGTLVPIMTLLRFKEFGHRVIFMFGGGTGLVGDPSGKKQERLLNDEKTVNEFVLKFMKQFSQFAKPDEKSIFFVNNADWLCNLKAIEMWRDYGKHFPINVMMQKDSVKSRLENGLTYLEFSYMIMQAIDFLTLYENPKFNCELEIGGQDQWGNITAGVELIRRKLGSDKKVFGLTMPLITKSDGTKYGKTESGAIWLSKEKTSPYEMYQFFINTSDNDVISHLKLLTLLSKEKIDELESSLKTEPHLRKAQKALAEEVVLFCHGKEELDRAINLTETLFKGEVNKLSLSDIKDAFKDADTESIDSKINLVDALILLKLASSKREAREFILNGAISLNGNLTKNVEEVICKDNAIGKTYSIIRRGKKKYAIIKHN